ncbi:hypothetical protein FKP32DRAFT_584142 [Trametes sanguinea]|nr:hypothetical protein FKP32DRAFT_584142 [Trametes sanguinea]
MTCTVPTTLPPLPSSARRLPVCLLPLLLYSHSASPRSRLVSPPLLSVPVPAYIIAYPIPTDDLYQSPFAIPTARASPARLAPSGVYARLVGLRNGRPRPGSLSVYYDVDREGSPPGSSRPTARAHVLAVWALERVEPGTRTPYVHSGAKNRSRQAQLGLGR